MDVGNKDERDGGFIGLAGGLLALVVILVVVFSSSCWKRKFIKHNRYVFGKIWQNGRKSDKLTAIG